MSILGFLSGVSGAAKSMPKVVSGIANGIDALHFSSEEKAQLIIDVSKTVVDYAKQTINESSIRSMTRRMIALEFTTIFLALIVFAAIMWRWDISWAAHVFNCALVLKNPIIAIILFYFGSYGLGYLLDKKNKKD